MIYKDEYIYVYIMYINKHKTIWLLSLRLPSLQSGLFGESSPGAAQEIKEAKQGFEAGGVDRYIWNGYPTIL